MMRDGTPTAPATYVALSVRTDRTVPTVVATSAADIAASRAAGAKVAMADRLRNVVDAMRDVALTTTLAELDLPLPDARARVESAAEFLAKQGPTEVNVNEARAALRALRSRLSDGSDEARYAAVGAALEALGRLWAAS